MTQRNKNNSIIFLTTLSVYLGLVLVGGVAPTVLAQAATTRNFNVQDEIEVKDDLDKKPDDEKLDFSGALESYFGDVEDIIENLEKYYRKRNLDSVSEKFDFESYTFVGCNNGGQSVVSGGFVTKVENRGVESAINSTIYNFDDWETFSDCLPTETSGKHFTNRSRLKISYDLSELRIEISAPKETSQRAAFLAERFNQSYLFYKVDEKSALISTIYQSTVINSENNQVFIVTRLPRGSLDALLKQDAKDDNQ